MIAGAFGDFGTLFPFAVAYITIWKLDPIGTFLETTVANLCLAVILKLPLPVQPKKAIVVTTIREKQQ